MSSIEQIPSRTELFNPVTTPALQERPRLTGKIYRGGGGGGSVVLVVVEVLEDSVGVLVEVDSTGPRVGAPVVVVG